MNLLIVDDYPANRKLLRVALEAQRHEVCEASNGIEALQRLEGGAVDAVISDILMPGMDGFRLCLEVRRNESLRSLPLVLYTSTYNSPSDRFVAESVGADAYIIKPALTSTILEAIAAARQRPHSTRGPSDGPHVHPEVLEQYNAALVRKLEGRNTELQQALGGLAEAHDQMQQLNRALENRYTQRAAELDAANGELESFCRALSTDLMTPIRSIQTLAQSLLEDRRSDPGKDAEDRLSRILACSRHVDATIRTLLEFSRSGNVALRMEEVDLGILLDGVIEELQAQVGDQIVDWRCERLPVVRADSALMRRVFLHLLSNALKFSRTRPVSVIEIGHRAGRGDETVIYIKDNGVGFDQARAKELFGVCRRLHGAEGFEGAGLGLANAQRIISRHGGVIWVAAARDRGATFFVSLRPTDALAP